MQKEQLITKVIEQIKKDLAVPDTEALYELLTYVPSHNLVGYLPEEEAPITVDLTLIEYLQTNEIDYKELNGGVHVVVIGKDFQTYDVYPTTEKWKARAATDWGKGLKNFYRELEGK